MENDTLNIFRNCGFEYPLFLLDSTGYPIDLDGYEFAFIIAPTQPNRTFGIPTFVNTSPVISSGAGSITFVMLAGDTSTLQIGTAYEYRTMIQAPSNSPQVIEWGRVRVKDAPQFPGD
jgi:hypothetical protein